ncbi:helix-turn-helix transcriptional regulator [Chitinispirillales bacterium ANBcel5]|uniref:helix-turn-helix domain-containing protein n=1 Tax=Cellulosispirillum alkaliphilum TaxID=3039283 RepID=UPI002A51BBB7|nr:helix-turn-helix transcriptional regulator [Chitinispirillales bacterium ANBcel5]
MKKKKPGPKRGTKHSDIKRSPLGQRLFDARKVRGITQQELANKLGITKRMVANYEGNSEGPSVERLEDIAKALNVTVSYLLGESTLKTVKEDISPNIRKHIEVLKELPQKDQKKVLEYAELLKTCKKDIQ